MNADRLDLLPESHRRALKRAYRYRLISIGALLALILVIAAAALLVPAYVYLVSAEQAKRVQLATVETTLSSGDEAALAKRLAALEMDAGTITALSATPSTSEVIREVLAIPRPGVALSGANYMPGKNARPGSVAVTGVAATRNDLRAYQIALAGAPQFSAADLPVASYAKDSDIPFTVTVTLATSTTP